jgi:excisionase family DNA binding protein
MNNRDKFTDYEALPLVLEVKDIQNILGISRTTAYALVKQPDFPTFRSGSRIKISKKALFDWMAGGGKNADGK